MGTGRNMVAKDILDTKHILCYHMKLVQEPGRKGTKPCVKCVGPKFSKVIASSNSSVSLDP